MYLAVSRLFFGFVMSPVCSCSRSTRRLSLGWCNCPAELLVQQESPLPTASAAPPSSHLTDAYRRKTPPSHSPLPHLLMHAGGKHHHITPLSLTHIHNYLSSSPICFYLTIILSPFLYPYNALFNRMVSLFGQDGWMDGCIDR